MFRDSRGVVHTISSADPLDDLPPEAAQVLQAALLRPVDGDVASVLERCDAVTELIERWQDAFFASLPDAFDIEEERRWAADAGMSLDEIEAEYAEEDAELDLDAVDDLGTLLPVDPLLDADDEGDPRTVLTLSLIHI